MKTSFSFRKSLSFKCGGFAILLLAVLSLNPSKSYAFSCPSTRGYQQIETSHDQGRDDINEHTAQEFNRHRQWIVETFFREQLLPALQLFTEQMTAVAMQQAMSIGMFLDAKNQLETQRLLQELQVEAHKDYQPSTTFCAFGTNTRSLAMAESAARYNTLALSRRQLARHTGLVNMGSANSAGNDKIARWEQFTEIYCDPQDNNWIDGTGNTGLIPQGNASPANNVICKAIDSNRVNLDIDYTRALENRRTLDISRTFDIGSADEIDIQALGNNLYGHDILFRNISQSGITEENRSKLYLNLRALAAKRSVAENSFNTIVGMKSLSGANGLHNLPVETWQYLGAILKELGIPENEITEYVGASNSGRNFSYYNQLEILAKRIYQNPNFYANLYDKPANVERISAALTAIELMLDRDIYESQLRQEMAMSVLLAARLQKQFKDIDKDLEQ